MFTRKAVATYIGQEMPMHPDWYNNDISNLLYPTGTDIVTPYRDLKIEQEDVVVSGDCLVTIPLMGSFPQHRLIWYDAHLDSHTPDTSQSGHLGGMPASILVGRCFPKLRQSIGLKEPIQAGQIIHMDGHAADEGEEIAGWYPLHQDVYDSDERKVVHIDIDILKDIGGHWNDGRWTVSDLINSISHLKCVDAFTFSIHDTREQNEYADAVLNLLLFEAEAVLGK